MKKTRKMKRVGTALCLMLTASSLATLAACDSTTNQSSQRTDSENSQSAAESSETLYKQSFETFEEELMQRMEALNAASASMAVTENGEVIHFKGFGKANKEENSPVTKDTLYNTGSLGKIYLTAAMLKLAEDGKIDLDAAAIDYLPEFTMADERYKDITIRMLLNHRSGLPNDLGSVSGDWATDTFVDEYNQQLLKKLAVTSLKSVPGEQSNYCNIGFGLAQMILERVSGQTYVEYLNEQFFQPLGITTTFAGNVDTTTSKQMARTCDAYGNQLPVEYEAASVTGLGGLTSTPEATCKFIDNLLSPEAGILGEESIAQLRSDQSLTANFPKQERLNALGWDYVSTSLQGETILTKAGGTTNYFNYVATAPDAGLTISVSVAAHDLALGHAVDTLLQEMLVEKGRIKQAADISGLPEEMSAEELSAEEQERTNAEAAFAGNYYGEVDADENFTSELLKKVEFADNCLVLSHWFGEWTEVGRYTRRTDGTYGNYDETVNKYTGYSFEKKNNETYLMETTRTPQYEETRVNSLKLSEGVENAAWENRNNRIWLRTNISAHDYQAFACFTMTQTLPDVTGYVLMNGLMPLMKITDDYTAAGIDQAIGYHHAQVTIKDTTMTYAGWELMDSAEAKPLDKGETAVSFDKANTAQWFVAAEDMKLTVADDFETVRVIAFDAELQQIYDNIGQEGEIEVQAGGYVMLTSAIANHHTTVFGK